MLTVKIHNYYSQLASVYGNGNQDYYNYDNYEDEKSEDEEADVYEMLASVGSTSVVFAGLYTGCLALALSAFGAMSVVGCVSFRGNYIAPQYTGSDNNVVSKKNLGIFLGALVLFSNLCLVCAVVLGEFQVRQIPSIHHLLRHLISNHFTLIFFEKVTNYLDNRQKQELGYFAIERISTVLGIMCMFLAVVYFGFALVVFALKDVAFSESQDEVEQYIPDDYKPPHLIHGLNS